LFAVAEFSPAPVLRHKSFLLLFFKKEGLEARWQKTQQKLPPMLKPQSARRRIGRILGYVGPLGAA
jgi:hypothetical protein